MKIKKLHKPAVTLFLALRCLSLFSQHNIPLNHTFLHRYEPYLYSAGSSFHTSVKPYLYEEVKEVNAIDSVEKSWLYTGERKILQRLMNDTLFSINRPSLHADAGPLLNLRYGNDWVEAGAGVSMSASFKKKLYLYADVTYATAEFPSYLDSIIKATGVVPGSGAVLRTADTAGWVSWYNYSGNLSYKASDYFSFQVGMGKHFIGDGYRSLLLSDNAYNYPYFKITTSIWKLKYVNLFTNFKDIRYDFNPRNKAYNKYGAFHYLSWNITKRITIGFFESIIFETRDTTGRFNYDINYLNPVIFYRPVEYSIGSADNALMGLNLKVTPLKKQVIYGQLMLDEFLLKEIKADIKKALNKADPATPTGWWANKYGIQAGFKSFDLFGVKNLSLQGEYNFVRPWTYTHGSVYQNYGHYNQPLAHPLGANFKEAVSFARYYYKRFYSEAKFLYAVYGEDDSTAFGKNIFVPYTQRHAEYGHFTGQGVKTNLIYKGLKAGYMINPKNNFCVEAGFINRDFKNRYGRKNDNFYYISLKTAINNFYTDF